MSQNGLTYRVTSEKVAGEGFKVSITNVVSGKDVVRADLPVVTGAITLSLSLILSYNHFSPLIRLPHWRLAFSCHQVQSLALSLLFSYNRVSRVPPLATCLLLSPVQSLSLSLLLSSRIIFYLLLSTYPRAQGRLGQEVVL